MIRRCRKCFHANNAFQDCRGERVVCGGRNNARTVDKIYTASQSNVLPDFSFPRNRSNLANFATLECVYDTAFPDVWIANESDRDLLLVRMKLRKLAEELDKRAFTK